MLPFLFWCVWLFVCFGFACFGWFFCLLRCLFCLCFSVGIVTANRTLYWSFFSSTFEVHIVKMEDVFALITVGRHRLGPEYVQILTPQTWPHPNTMRASGARALGGMFCNARATHTAKLCPKNTGAKTQKCWDKKSCAGSAGAKKVYAGHASHTLAHCFQEMSACMIADI